MSLSEQIEQLAAAIGEEVYIDVGKWHLYLRDAKLHTVLAEKIFPDLDKGKRPDLELILGTTFVAIGGGKRQVPLSDLIPSGAQAKLSEIVQDFR